MSEYQRQDTILKPEDQNIYRSKFNKDEDME